MIGEKRKGKYLGPMRPFFLCGVGARNVGRSALVDVREGVEMRSSVALFDVGYVLDMEADDF